MTVTANSRGTTYTDFTFEVRGKVTVTLKGNNTEELYEKALEKAVEQAADDIDIDWINDCTNSETYNEYEEDG